MRLGIYYGMYRGADVNLPATDFSMKLFYSIVD